MHDELFGQRDHRQLAGATAIILGLAAALENTIGIVVGGRAGRNSSPSRLMRLGLCSCSSIGRLSAIVCLLLVAGLDA